MKKTATALAVILILAGGLTLTYPFWSSYYSARQQGQSIQAYITQVEGISAEEKEKIWQEAVFYNTNRVNTTWLTPPYTPDDTVTEEYLGVLRVGGIMGHLEIPKIDASLAIYHGVANQQISTGAGHFPWSGLPVGSEGNHCVLTSHSALASARLLTDLDDLEPGDTFFLHILDQTLAYQVEQITVVWPDEIDALMPVEGEDLVTLITCTPYAINSHRLLVRGTRIDYTPQDAAAMPDAGRASPSRLLFIGIGIGAAIILISTCILIRKRRR